MPLCVEIPIPNPPCSFRGVSTLRPLPEHLPNVRVYRREDGFCHDVAVIHCPAPNDRIEFLYHYRLCGTCVAFDDFPDPREERLNAFPGRLDQKLAVVLAYILAEKIEPLRDVGDPGFLIREL
jgi:hypothetical protein